MSHLDSDILYGHLSKNQNAPADKQSPVLIEGEHDYPRIRIWKYFMDGQWLGTSSWQARGRLPTGLFSRQKAMSEQSKIAIRKALVAVQAMALSNERYKIGPVLDHTDGDNYALRPILTSIGGATDFVINADDLEIVRKVIDKSELTSLHISKENSFGANPRLLGADNDLQLLFVMEMEQQAG